MSKNSGLEGLTDSFVDMTKKEKVSPSVDHSLMGNKRVLIWDLNQGEELIN